MTTQEFSDQFDILFNNITSNQAPGINEYEKSVFLTKALNQLVTEYFNNRVDQVGGGFDGSQKRQYDFSSLIKIANPSYVLWATPTIDRRSLVYIFPKDFYLSVNEMLSDGSYQYSVSALSYAEYLRLMLKPYSFPVKKEAWRLLSGKEICNIYSNDGYYFVGPYTGQKITLVIKLEYQASITPTTPENWGTTIAYTTKNGVNILITPTVSTSGDTKTITLDCKVDTAVANVSDNLAVKLLLEAFQLLLYSKNHNIISIGNSITAGIALNWLQTFIAPESKEDFLTMESTTLVGKTIESSVVKGLPFVEIIGKFKTTPPEYQLRYILKPKPIILDDLTDYGVDLTIDGESGISECILPEETHQEILERAVTLAKIAWQGGTATQAANLRSKDD